MIEEMSKCAGCGKPRFTPGLCQECQENKDFQIRELQTQVILYKKLTEEQKKMLDEIKEYAEDQRYKNPTLAWSLRSILKLKDCGVCGKLQENCTCCVYCQDHECGTCPEHGEFHSGTNPNCPCGGKH